jgi:hypothetical protein
MLDLGQLSLSSGPQFPQVKGCKLHIAEDERPGKREEGTGRWSAEMQT